MPAEFEVCPEIYYIALFFQILEVEREMGFGLCPRRQAGKQTSGSRCGHCLKRIQEIILHSRRLERRS